MLGPPFTRAMRARSRSGSGSVVAASRNLATLSSVETDNRNRATLSAPWMGRRAARTRPPPSLTNVIAGPASQLPASRLAAPEDLGDLGVGHRERLPQHEHRPLQRR